MERLYINEILAGNTARFSYFIDTYKDMAYSIAYRITNNNEDAEEVVQDAFLKVYKALGGFRHDAKFSTWLYKIVVNTAFSKMKKGRLRTGDIESAEGAIEDTAEIDSAYKSLSQQEQKKFINQVLEELSADDSLLLTLFYLNENSIEEISEITGVISNNIKMKLHRARKKMYLALERKLKTELHSLL